MAKNKLTDLNDHLFAQLERLGDEELNNDQLTLETERAKALTMVSSQIIKSTSTSIKAAQVFYNHGIMIPQVSNLEIKKIE